MGLFGNSGQKALDDQLRAASPSDINTVRNLLDRGANANADPKPGKPSPLVKAASAGSLPVLELLLGRGAQIDRFGGKGFGSAGCETALNAACTEGHFDSVQLLLNRGASVDGVGMWSLPLVSALNARNLAMVQLLLKSGADPNRSKLGFTPAESIAVNLMCLDHGLRYGLKPGCKKCADRWLWLSALVLLKRSGGKGLMGYSKLPAALDEEHAVVADVIAWQDRREDRVDAVVDFLGNITYNDPMFRGMFMWGFGAALGNLGIPVPLSGLPIGADGSGFLELPDFGGHFVSNLPVPY